MTTHLSVRCSVPFLFCAMVACRDSTAPSLGTLTDISAGWAFTYHTCAVTTTGAAYCWGTNGYGELGNGRLPGTSSWEVTPKAVAGGLTFASVEVGHAFTCGLTSDGTAYCWGNNSDGELGKGALGGGDSVPVRVAGGLSLASISVGAGDACGLTSDGTAYCWGGFPTWRTLTPTAVGGALRFNQISAEGYPCGIATTGTTYCWNGLDLEPQALPGALSFVSISTGQGYTCGLTADGVAYCWGYNAWGQLGIGRFTNVEPEPTAVATEIRFNTIDAGVYHTCALSTDGSAYCWGSNLSWELGVGNPTLGYSSVPLQVVGGHTFRSISAGDAYTCGVTVDGAGYCWGKNSVGQLGTGAAGDEYRPRRINGF